MELMQRVRRMQVRYVQRRVDGELVRARRVREQLLLHRRRRRRCVGPCNVFGEMAGSHAHEGAGGLVAIAFGALDIAGGNWSCQAGYYHRGVSNLHTSRFGCWGWAAALKS